jgi:hemolysin activation/secretion protein
VGKASLDNTDPRSTDREKLTATLSVDNPFGIGEQFVLAAQASEGKSYGQLNYSQPLGSDGWRGGLNASWLDYELQGDFATLGGTGSAEVWGTSLTYPVLRSQQANLTFSLAYNHSHLVSDTDSGNISDKINDAITIGLNGDTYDNFGGGGVNVANLSVVTGEIDLSGNADELAQDAAGPQRDGEFTKLKLSAGRLQRLSEKGSGWLGINGQYAFGNLDSSEEISLGGPTGGVRAYPALEAAGDEGLVVTLEYRHELPHGFRGTLFYDWGTITINHSPYTGSDSPNSYHLHGAGLGLDWDSGNGLLIRGSLAWRIGDNPAAQTDGTDSDGSKDIPQFWLTSNIDF